MVVTVLFFTAALSFSSQFLLSYLIKNEVSNLIGEDSFVAGNHEDFDNEMFLNALKNKQYVNTYKTQPLERHSIRIVAHLGELELQVAQDSKYPYLYWVYYPKYRYSSYNQLGKLRIKQYE